MFEEVEKGEFKARPKMEGVTINFKTGSVRLKLSEAVHKKLGKPQFVKVLLGKGEHEGKVLLRKVDAKVVNAYSVHPGYRFISIVASKLGLERRAKFDTLQVTHEVVEEGLLLDLRGVKRMQEELLKAKRSAA